MMKRAVLIGIIVLAAACGDDGTTASSEPPATPPPITPATPQTNPPATPPPVAPPPPPLPGDPVAELTKMPGGCSSGGFCWRAPSPTGNRFDAVWGTASSDIWLSGSRGTILHWNGTKWESRPPPIAPCSNSDGVDALVRGGTGPSDAWMATGAGTAIFHWDGASWTMKGSLSCADESSGFGEVWSASPTDAWTSYGTNTVSRWNGTAWNPVAIVPDPINGDGGTRGIPISSIWGSAPNDVWLVGALGTIVHWDGAKFTSVPPFGQGLKALWKVWGSSKSDVWVSGLDATLLHFDGTTWTKLTPPTTAGLNAISGSGPNDVWFGGGNGVAIHATAGATGTLTLEDAGTKSKSTPSGRPLLDLWTESPTRTWGVGDRGEVYVRDTKSWSRVTGMENVTFGSAIWGTAPNDLWIVGGDIQHWDGTKLTSASAGTLYGLKAIDATSQSNIWVVGQLGRAHHFDGVSWTLETVGESVWLEGVHASADGGATAVADGGKIYRRTGGPSGTWSPMTSPTGADLFSVWGPSDDLLYAVGAAGTILKWDGGSWTADTSPVSAELRHVRGAPDGTVLITGRATPAVGSGALVAGTVLRLTAGSWVPETGVPIFDLWSISVKSATDAWAVGQNGVIVHLDGNEWKLVGSGADNTLVGIWLGASTHAMVLTDEGGMLEHP
jgi:hypothetical protein